MNEPNDEYARGYADGRKRAAQDIRNQMTARAAVPKDLRLRGRPNAGTYGEWAARIAGEEHHSDDE